MKLGLLAAAALLGLGSTASAQTTTTAFSFAGGVSLPLNRFKDTESRGYNGSVGFLFGSSDSPFGFRLEAGYDKLRGKTVGSTSFEGSRILSGIGSVVLSFSGSTVKPYMLAGIGDYRMRSDSSGAKAATRFGFNFGGGLSFPVGNRAGSIESRLQSISQNNARPLRYLQVGLGLLL